MAVAVSIHIDSRNLQHLLNVLPENLQGSVGDACYGFAIHSRDKLRESLFEGDGKRPLTMERAEAGLRIMARKDSKFRSHVSIPYSLKMLDSSYPHFLPPLKTGMKVNRWIKHNYGRVVVSGRSRLRFTKAGNPRGWLYVTPMPFVNRGLNRARKILTPTLRAGVRKAFRQSRR